MRNIIILVSLFIGLSQLSFSQTPTSNLLLFAKYTEQGVRLKVAPQSAATWLQGAEKGYVFYRRELGEIIFEKLNEQAVLPWDDSKIANSLGAEGDSLIDFQETSVFEQIRRSKDSRSPFETVQYEQEFNNGYGFYFLMTTRIPEISVISGLEYTDGQIVNGKAYEYKVGISGDSPENTTTCIIYTDAFTQILPPLDGYEGEKIIDLSWTKPENTNVISYYVERSDDSVSYERLTEAPIFLNLGDSDGEEGSQYNRIIRFKDSISQNYIPYYYRLIGIDVWGEETASSVAYSFMGRDRTAPELPDSLWVESNADSHSLKLQWKYSNQPSDLAGTMAFHGDSIEGIFTALTDSLMEPEIREAELGEVVPSNNHYFQLVVQDTAGNYTTSKMVYGYLADIYAPLVPQNLYASIDSMGAVSLSWDENSEKDLKGYAVYRSNGKTLRMIKISGYPVENNSFKDTLSLNRLNKETYYSVMALDMNFNYSGYSDTIQVLIPDTIVPAAPGLMRSELKSSVLSLSWIPSVSDDVLSQYVLSVDEDDQVLDTLDVLNASATSYSGPLTSGGWNYFAIRVADDVGNTSEMSPKTGVFVNEVSTQIEITALKVKKRKEGVEVSWKLSDDSNLQSRVYRKAENGSSVFLSQTKDSEYTDDAQLAKGVYHYYVVLVDEGGVNVSGSEMVEIKL